MSVWVLTVSWISLVSHLSYPIFTEISFDHYRLISHLLCHFYGRPPASWPTAIIFYCWCFYLTFFRRLISEVSGPIVTKLCHMFGGDCNFLMWVKNLGVQPPKIWRPKNVKISDFALWSRISPDGNKISSIGKRLENYHHSPTRLPNLANFGPQTAKNSTFISTHSIDFFGRSYLRG